MWRGVGKGRAIFFRRRNREGYDSFPKGSRYLGIPNEEVNTLLYKGLQRDFMTDSENLELVVEFWRNLDCSGNFIFFFHIAGTLSPCGYI